MKSALLLFDTCVYMSASLGEATFFFFLCSHSSTSLSQTEQTHSEAACAQSGSRGKEKVRTAKDSMKQTHNKEIIWKIEWCYVNRCGAWTWTEMCPESTSFLFSQALGENKKQCKMLMLPSGKEQIHGSWSLSLLSPMSQQPYSMLLVACLHRGQGSILSWRDLARCFGLVQCQRRWC